MGTLGLGVVADGVVFPSEGVIRADSRGLLLVDLTIVDGPGRRVPRELTLDGKRSVLFDGRRGICVRELQFRRLIAFELGPHGMIEVGDDFGQHFVLRGRVELVYS